MSDDDACPELDTICRLCLNSDAQVDIFSSGAANLSVPMRIMACLALEVQDTDDLPKNICTECRYQLEKSYYFRKRSQASDSKLRKHIRLLTLGKRSRVFANKTDEEEFEEEIEFEDSLRFIREEDDLRAKASELNWRKKISPEMALEMAKYKETLQQICRDEVKEELRAELIEEVRAELRGEVWQEAKEGLRSELELELREVLRVECIDEAKHELRQEVRDECRNEELKGLLGDLEAYLKGKRAANCETDATDNAVEKVVESCDEMAAQARETVGMASPKAKTKRRATSTSTPPRAQRVKLKMEGEQAAGSEEMPAPAETESERYESENPLAQHTMPFEIIPMPCDVAQDDNEIDDDNEDDPNIYILEADDGNEEHSKDSEQDEHEENEENSDDAGFYTAELDNFQLSSSEATNNKDTTSYQIDINDMRFYKKENVSEKVELEQANNDSNEKVIVFNFGDRIDSENFDTLELVNLDNKSMLMNYEAKPPKRTSSRRVKSTCSSMSGEETGKQDKALDPGPTLGTSMQRNTDTAKTFKCDQCPMISSTENALKRHFKTHKKLKENGIAYQCSECHIFVSCRSALTRHMVIHTGERPHKCPYCDKSFGQREVLKRHLQTHTGERPHKCNECGRTFTQKINLTMHMKTYHTSEPKVQFYACHLCPKRFHHASGLSRHLVAHNGVQYQCSKCERTFGDRSSVKRHIANLHASSKKVGVQKIEENGSD